MAKWQGRSLKKASGGRRWPNRKKRKYELGRESAETKIGPRRRREISVRGSGSKSKLLSVESANVTDPETGRSSKCDVHSVLENPADPHLARRNIVTKGAVIETEVGEARVTGRPGQEGALNAVLIEGDLEARQEGEPTEKKVPREDSEEDVSGEAGEGAEMGTQESPE